MLIISHEVENVYPEASLGLLVIRRVLNPGQHEALDRCKIELETDLRERYGTFTKADLKRMCPVRFYVAYYKQFQKTYHVLLQLESIVFKNKSIPRVASLVEAMFMAELKNLLLTAGHDLDSLVLPVTLDISKGEETYILINGTEKQLMPHDMMVSDLRGITSSMIYGPDQRTRITSDTKNVLFVVYGPPGVERDYLWEHLEDIQRYVQVITPQCEVELKKVYTMLDLSL